MNQEEFNITYAKFSSRDKISIDCSECGHTDTRSKTKVQQKIARDEEYLCAKCSFRKRFKLISDETRAKLRAGRLGKKQSVDAKEKMSVSKKALYQTPHGHKLRRDLSKKAALQHAQINVETTRRRGLYPSKKNGKFMVFGSSYELRAQVALDNDSEVVNYESQVYFEIEERHRSLDLLILYRSGRSLAVEIKAKERLTEQTVIDQIADSDWYASKMGYDFEVWTEQDLGFKSPHEATKWADKFISQMTAIDYVEIRRKKNAEKSLKHYKNRLSDQIEVYCPYCEESHTLREEQYLDNIEKNGRFICIKENGHIVGSRPKDHLKNPLAAEGKKKCSGECGRVLDLDCFSSKTSPLGDISSVKNQRRALCSPLAQQEIAVPMTGRSLHPHLLGYYRLNPLTAGNFHSTQTRFILQGPKLYVCISPSQSVRWAW